MRFELVGPFLVYRRSIEYLIHVERIDKKGIEKKRINADFTVDLEKLIFDKSELR